jgi:ATP-dependent RNA helicase DDX3X
MSEVSVTDHATFDLLGSNSTNMADQLNMNGLSLNESKHANGIPARSAYIPPHMRGQAGGPPPMSMDGAPHGSEMGLGGSAWGNNA